MKTRLSFFILAGIVGVSILISCSKSDNNTQPANDKYFPQVKTIITGNCLSCHSSSGSWQGRPVKFDNDSDISSQYIAIKKAVADPVTITNKRMPQGGELSASDIDVIVKWFNKGGKVTD